MPRSIRCTESRPQALEDLIRTEALLSFDLETDQLVRAKLIRIADDEYVLLFTMHHIVSDGWSLGVLYRELGECYAAYSDNEQPELATGTIESFKTEKLDLLK